MVRLEMFVAAVIWIVMIRERVRLTFEAQPVEFDREACAKPKP